MPNPVLQHKLFDLAHPRNLGRGQSRNSSNAVHSVTWAAGQVSVNGSAVLAIPTQPVYLDFAYDLLNRPQIVWQGATGESFIYYYDTVLSDFAVNSLGILAGEPIICNDHQLLGTNTIAVYLKNKIPHYRLGSDRYLIEYQWANAQYAGIKALGYCAQANSINLLLG